MQHLFHVSEQSDIKLFEPRMPPTAHATIASPVVWAVDQAHLANYFLPRECPRVTFHRLPDSSHEDCERFMLLGETTYVVAIESRWFAHAARTKIWIYEFSPESFWCADVTAGYFVSATAVTPLGCRCIDNPLEALVASGVELRIVPSLLALSSAVVSSSLGYSRIRMRNMGIGPVAQ